MKTIYIIETEYQCWIDGPDSSCSMTFRNSSDNLTNAMHILESLTDVGEIFDIFASADENLRETPVGFNQALLWAIQGKNKVLIESRPK
tara:strand:- start:658 stop:924 length:267 start_codon:yes stop_codon:yes gene_type:complete